jgi:hypothetical protein
MLDFGANLPLKRVKPQKELFEDDFEALDELLDGE